MLQFFQTKIPPHTPGNFYRTILLLALSVMLILVVFQPFGTYTFEHPYKYWLLAGYGLVIFAAGIAGLGLWNRLGKNWLNKGDWTIGKELSSILFIVFVCITATYFYHYFTLGGHISLYSYTYFTGIALLSAIFPLTLVLTIRYLMVKTKLEKEQLIKQQTQKEEPVTLLGANKDEKVLIHLSELLYARTADNYIELLLEKDDRKIEKVLLRNSLSALAKQLENTSNCHRVHRSFLVNTDQVAKMEGKSPDYYLVFKNHPSTVPVSRKMYPRIRALLKNKPI